jgi:hypothetical protein
MTVRITLMALLALALSLTLVGQNAQQTYQRALVLEQASGNLKEAIELYSQVMKSAGPDRALAARALVRIAGAQEKLGQKSEAADSYARILKTYPEQREQAALAQERLNALQRTPSSTRPQDVSSAITPVFQTYCAACHNATNRSGGLDLATLNPRDVGSNTSAWETVLSRLQARRDPPMGAPRPEDKTYRSIIARLETALDNAYPANGTLETAERITDMEFATRLAAFLWGTVPDASLLGDARNGRLWDQATLERQVIRMLRDPKASHLVSNFFEPWLMLDKLDAHQVDPAIFPQFDAELLQAMRTENRLFFEDQLRENRNALELWTGKYTFLNERLARHYGVKSVQGNQFRRIAWPDDTRAGVLGQAGILTALSFGTRTSPTQRGVFVFSRFLGMSAPAPPPNVPALSDTPQDRARPFRERMAAHSSHPACASCHLSFDPLGMGLENFDAIGQWRPTEGGIRIDASGTFIDGTRFGGPAELRTGLLKHRDAYYSNVTQELLAHALNRKGRSRRIYDYEMPSVRAIVRTAAERDYRWSSLISGIVMSAPFQMKDIVP